MISYSSSLALFPLISRRLQGSKEAYARTLERCTKYLTIVGIPLCGCIFLLSHQLMVGLYSSKFAASGTCLAILIWSRLITFAIFPGQQAVWARNGQLWLVPPAIIRCVVNMALNIYLIPRYGVNGASVSMVITDNLHYSLMYIFAFRGPERFKPVALLGRPVLAGLAMAAAVLLARPLGIVAATVAGMIAYVWALPAFGAIDADDKRILSGLVANFRNRRQQVT
jgi:O-antigen/teichoic acid export membrane protein